MKYLIPLFVLVVFLGACSQGPVSEHPESIEEKRALLKEKQTALKEITAQITQLEKEINELDPSASVKARRLVTTAVVQRTDFQHFVEIQGSVQADDYVDVTSETAGRILRLAAKEGDNVRAGQLIAELDLEQLKKQMSEVEKSLELAKTVYERQKRLWDQNIGSEIQYLEAKNGKERLEKSMETLQYQLTKSKVYAPASGVVERVVLQAGEIAMPGAPILQILNPQKLKVVAAVPETYLRAVSRGEKVKVRLPALNVEQEARVTLIGSSIDPSNRTFEVEADIQSQNGLIKPNLLAVMFIKDDEQKGVVAIPQEMVQQEVSGKDFVYIKGEAEDGPVARKVYVRTGKSFRGNVVIEDGLQGGEELILDGARGLAENEPIKVQAESERLGQNG
ncbi:MAG: efflux RND transporter periplasmic adaptor subunit [Phaeodactylibacter sp.]|nr:efflux RND transporter periplasmic adaptor subunit [Phaeodactylibacter sp.]MCB9051995.1 efflux RND transporter periplasmic adaptor subunit [Lewinellaceae bacterium]